MFRKFVCLLALARERHFGRAAASCNVSQPTLSNAIRQLKEELQAPIVERGQKFAGFTPEGEKVLDYARRIVAERNGLRQELAALGQGLSGHLRIGASVTSLSSRGVQRGLDAFELDAAVTYLDNEPLSGVRTVPLCSERYYLLAPRALVPEGATSIGWAQAADRPLCLLTPDMQNRRIADAAFRMADRAVMPLVETNSIVTLYTIVRGGLGASVVPGQLLTLVSAHPDLVALPLTDPDLTYPVGLACADREPAPPLARALAAVAAEDGLAQRIRALTDKALLPWRRGAG